MPIITLSEKDVEDMNNEMINWVKSMFKTQYGPNIFNMLMSVRHMIDNIEYEIRRIKGN